mmetsp:Transcript_35180/g.41976  ORF Transcript_35180/g.41976 Transcript_35180/m.41976 type:complete len:305 (-) Transcript_35180:287-1201(-)
MPFLLYWNWNWNTSFKHTTPSTKIKRSKKRLEFVHITKNGGSAIEQIAASQGILWGACHYMNITEVGCHGADIPYTAPDYQSFALTSPWHTPPKVLHARVKPEHTPYKDADLFAVIRNPYSRIVSEYYCPWTGIQRQQKRIGDKIGDPDKMNEWIVRTVNVLDTAISKYNSLSSNDRRPKEQGPGLNEDPHSLAQKHFINQAEYVFDGENRVIDNIVYYESIQTDFNELMKKYDMGHLQLPDKESHGVNTRKSGSKSKLSHLNLYPDTLAVINKYARVDFTKFGYEMVDTFKDRKEYSLSASGP